MTRMTGKVMIGAAIALGCCALVGGQTAGGQDAAPAPGAPETPPKNTLRQPIKSHRFDYTCESGAKVTVYLHDTTAKVLYEDHVYLMHQTVSADGNRYSDGKTVWWGRGDEGFLQEDTPEGDGKRIAKDCVLEKASAQATITGTITYLARMALPPQATIHVQLQDVSRADAPAAVIAEEKFALGQLQVPLQFTLKFNPAKIDEKHTYSVSARVAIGTELLFVTDKPYPVLTQGNPSKVDLILKPAKP